MQVLIFFENIKFLDNCLIFLTVLKISKIVQVLTPNISLIYSHNYSLNITDSYKISISRLNCNWVILIPLLIVYRR
jgi:hypothetical protein